MLMVGFNSGLFRRIRSQGSDVNGRLKSAANPCGLRKSTDHIYLYITFIETCIFILMGSIDKHKS
ncbi:hypothetical protein Hdeb2414_s0002g00067031 [Helianthus debilis subsp. tardiflorus]